MPIDNINGLINFQTPEYDVKVNQSSHIIWQELAFKIPEILGSSNSNQFDIFNYKIKELGEYKVNEIENTFSKEEQSFILRDLLFILSATMHSRGFNQESRIPNNLSNAVRYFSDTLNLPPFLHYNLYVLHNFAKNSNEPLLSFTDYKKYDKNIESITQNTRNQNPKHNDEHHFIKIHKNTELALVRSLTNLQSIMKYSKESYKDDYAKQELDKYMMEISEDFKTVREVIKNMYVGNGKSYFNQYRSYFNGSDKYNTEDGKKGVYDESNQLVTCHNGMSGAQSATIQILDAFFSNHELRDSDVENFIKINYASLPKEHQKIIQDVKDYKNKIGFDVLKTIPNFNNVRNSIDNFRSSHKNLAVYYLGDKGEGTAGTNGGSFLSKFIYTKNTKNIGKQVIDGVTTQNYR